MQLKESRDFVIDVNPVEFAKQLLPIIKDYLEDFKREYQGNEMFFNREQAAEYLHVSLPTIDKLVQEGIIDKYQLPGTSVFRFKRSDLEYCLQKINFKGKKNSDSNKVK